MSSTTTTTTVDFTSILVTTVGGDNSNSYVTLSEAETYLASCPQYTLTLWDALSQAQKERSLIDAARLLDSLKLRGKRASIYQALEFPRWWSGGSGFPQDEDYPPDDDDYANEYEHYADIAAAGATPPSLPDVVKEVQCDLAFQVIVSGVYQLDPLEAPSREIRRFELGGALGIEFFGGSVMSLSKASLSSLDIVFWKMRRWIKHVGGAVV